MEGNRKEYGVSFWGDENILKLTVMMVAQFCEYTIIELCTIFFFFLRERERERERVRGGKAEGEGENES